MYKPRGSHLNVYDLRYEIVLKKCCGKENQLNSKNSTEWSFLPSPRALVLNWLAKARKSGGPQTSAYFKNGFACRVRLRNTGLCELPYGPAQRPLFFGDQFYCHDIWLFSQWHCNHPIKVLMKVRHGTKKVVSHCPRACLREPIKRVNTTWWQFGNKLVFPNQSFHYQLRTLNSFL